jgi:RNA-directed DNA polymerase
VLAVSGTRAHAEALREEAAEILSTMGLRLSPEKTLITHVDEGLDFLGWRVQRHRKRGTRDSLPRAPRRPTAGGGAGGST